MASSVIHMAVAHEINKKLNRNNEQILLGSIAPDIAKCVGNTKFKSHFLDVPGENIPNIERFLDKYQKYLSNDFVMGYYIHLYTDYLWFKYFIPEIIDEDKKLITKIDGTTVNYTKDTLLKYVYNDYTNLNHRLLDTYDIDISQFYKGPPKIEPIIEEIPNEKISLIIDKVLMIIENSKKNKEYVFNMEHIQKFISMSTELILSKIKKFY